MPRPFPAKHTPAPVTLSVPAYQPPTIGQSIKDGFGLGVGVNLASRLVSEIFGPPTVQTVQVPTVSAFEQCIAEHRDNVGACAHLATGGQTGIKK